MNALKREHRTMGLERPTMLRIAFNPDGSLKHAEIRGETQQLWKWPKSYKSKVVGYEEAAFNAFKINRRSVENEWRLSPLGQQI